jgi:hypothetical protein
MDRRDAELHRISGASNQASETGAEKVSALCSMSACFGGRGRRKLTRWPMVFSTMASIDFLHPAFGGS